MSVKWVLLKFAQKEKNEKNEKMKEAETQRFVSCQFKNVKTEERDLIIL